MSLTLRVTCEVVKSRRLAKLYAVIFEANEVIEIDLFRKNYFCSSLG